jgi:hypothetical protein
MNINVVNSGKNSRDSCHLDGHHGNRLSINPRTTTTLIEAAARAEPKPELLRSNAYKLSMRHYHLRDYPSKLFEERRLGAVVGFILSLIWVLGKEKRGILEARSLTWFGTSFANDVPTLSTLPSAGRRKKIPGISVGDHLCLWVTNE